MRKTEYVRGAMSSGKGDASESSTARKQIDWESVEQAYRIGIKTLRQIAEDHSITHGAINKRAKRDGWERDLSERIAAQAEALVSKALAVSKPVSKTRKVIAKERAIVESNAKVIATAVIIQRRDVAQARDIVQKLFAEIEGMIDGLESVHGLGELMAADPEAMRDRLNGVYRSVIAMPQRIDSTRKLADALRVLIELERKVLRIKDDSAIDDLAKRFSEGVEMAKEDAYRAMCNDPNYI